MVKSLPVQPDFKEFKDALNKYEFYSFLVDTEVTPEASIELPPAYNFVGVVQLANMPQYRALFMRQSNPFSAAQQAYTDEIDGLVAEAEAEGVVVRSMEDLQAWASGETVEDESPVNVSFLEQAIRDNEQQ